jgi:Tfp pilus assembly protein PilO
MFTILFWKKVWSYVRAYWYIPFILVVLIALFAVGRGDTAKKILEQANESRKKLNEANERIEAERMKKQAENLENYIKAKAAVEKKYSEEKRQLDKKTDKLIKEIVKEHQGDHEGLAKKFSEEFGITLKEG